MPRLLPEDDIRIIHAIKNANKAWNFAIPEAISKQTMTPAERYSERMLNEYMINLFCRYITVCDVPASAVRYLLDVMRNADGTSLWHSIAIVLCHAQVKTKNPDGSYKYVNGFWEIPKCNQDGFTINTGEDLLD